MLEIFQYDTSYEENLSNLRFLMSKIGLIGVYI